MTMLNTLKDNKELAKLVLFTPFLYPQEKGFTTWNLINILITSFNKNNELVNKFNANNTAAVFFGAIMYHIYYPKIFNQWLKKDNYSLFTEKFFHILPVVYYYHKGYYSTTNIPISCLSLFYEYTWANMCGKYVLDKGDMYFPLKTYTDWCLLWCFICYGHFFNMSSNYIFKGLLLNLTCKITKLVTPQLCQQ
jgi:hypothetical protein